jgi:hypothetical protein
LNLANLKSKISVGLSVLPTRRAPKSERPEFCDRKIFLVEH